MNNTNQVTEQDLEQINQQIKNHINNKSKHNLGIRGHIKVFITRVSGKKELVFEDHNAIQAAYANATVDMLDTTTDFTLADDRFNGNTNLGAGNNGENGIAIKDGGGLWYEMIMATPVVTLNTYAGADVLFVGTFTGTGITVADANSVLLGHSWNNGGLTFDTLIAKPSSWSSQAVGAAEILTIEWTISHDTV